MLFSLPIIASAAWTIQKYRLGKDQKLYSAV